MKRLIGTLPMPLITIWAHVYAIAWGHNAYQETDGNPRHAHDKAEEAAWEAVRRAEQGEEGDEEPKVETDGPQPTKTWNFLTAAQQDAILAFTREAPNDEPNGAVEKAVGAILREVEAEPPGPFRNRIARLMSELCTASADDIRALRESFGLEKDGVTPVDPRADKTSRHQELGNMPKWRLVAESLKCAAFGDALDFNEKLEELLVQTQWDCMRNKVEAGKWKRRAYQAESDIARLKRQRAMQDEVTKRWADEAAAEMVKRGDAERELEKLRANHG